MTSTKWTQSTLGGCFVLVLFLYFIILCLGIFLTLQIFCIYVPAPCFVFRSFPCLRVCSLLPLLLWSDTWQKQLKERSFASGWPFEGPVHWGGSVWRQELEAAGLLSTEKAASWSSAHSLLTQLESPAPVVALPAFMLYPPILLNEIYKIFYRHPKACLFHNSGACHVDNIIHHIRFLEFFPTCLSYGIPLILLYKKFQRLISLNLCNGGWPSNTTWSRSALFGPQLKPHFLLRAVNPIVLLETSPLYQILN